MARKVFLSILLWLWMSVALAEVWSHGAQRGWDEQWEQAYSKWVFSEVSTDWVRRPEFLFYNWKLDCADFVYLTRIYFSYKNGLEFKIHDPTHRQKYISSRSNTWDEIRSGEDRLKRFSAYVLKLANTTSLISDTTLTGMNLANMRPGAILLGDRKRQHSMLIKAIRPSGIPLLIFGTLPESEFLYESYVFPTSENIFPKGLLPSEFEGGLRRWKWPQHLGVSSSLIPYHSMEQTQVKYANFFDTVMNRLRVKERNLSEQFQYMLDEACMKVRVRVNVIMDAGHALRRLKGGRFTDAELDLYSTYNRDRDIQNTFRSLDQFYVYNQSDLTLQDRSKYQNLLVPRFNSDDFCWVQWADNRMEPLGFLRQKFIDQRVSSNPYGTFSERWGE